MPKQIMIIDDEPDILTYLMAAVEDMAHEAISIEIDASIIKKIKQINPHLIILDIMMPQRSGISIYKEIRSSSELKSIPIVIMSGMDSKKYFTPEGFNDLVQNKKIPPPDGFLEKPVNLAEFKKIIDKLIP